MNILPESAVNLLLKALYVTKLLNAHACARDGDGVNAVGFTINDVILCATCLIPVSRARTFSLNERRTHCSHFPIKGRNTQGKCLFTVVLVHLFSVLMYAKQMNYYAITFWHVNNCI